MVTWCAGIFMLWQRGWLPGALTLQGGLAPIGIGTWFALKARGVDKVLVSEPSADRRTIIAKLGATVVDPVSEDLAAVIADLTGGDGLDVAIDAAGAGAAISSALAGLSAGGRVVVAALHEHGMDFNPTMLSMGETEIVGSVGYQPEEFDAVIAAMAASVYDTTGWVEEIPLTGIVDAMHALRSGAGAKILIKTD